MSNEQKPIVPTAAFVAVGATFVALISVFVPIMWLKFTLLGLAVLLLVVAGVELGKLRKKNR